MVRASNTRRRPAQFELIGGNVCLDFINTLDDRPESEPTELLKSYHDLARFGEDAGLLTPAQAEFLVETVRPGSDEAKETLRRAIQLREALHDIFSALMAKRAAPQTAIDRLNIHVQDAARHSRLVQQGGRLEWRSDSLTSAPGAMLWPIARAAAALLASSEAALVRACSSPACRWFFLDTSKNHQRRWCSMKLCGNRAKVREFYARKRKSEKKSSR
jgi:predicted RNA-binding Zn ribbon-like protein